MGVKESFILNIALPIAECIQGTCASKWFRQISKMHNWEKSQIEDWQNARLHALMDHVYNNTVYYRNIFDSLGLKPSDIWTIEDLKKLPTIDKKTAIDHFQEIVPSNLKSFKYRKGKTGGTTGEPMFYYCDENTWGYVTANKIHNWKRTGYRYGDAFVAMGSSSLFSDKPSFKRRVYDWLRKEYGLNSVSLTDDKCEKYAEFIKAKNIHYINGYAASLFIFAQYVRRHNINLNCIKVVFSTSENLTDDYRLFIEDTFKCHVMDCYGARDAGISAYESSIHKYQIGYNVLVEITDEIAPNTGSVLSTNLLNYTFPLIRYKFGDEAELDPNPEGYNGQQFTRILGRTSDVLRLDNGHNLSATGFSMIMKHFDIVAFNFKKIDGYHVLLVIQPRENYSKGQESTIITTIQGYLGDDCQISVEYVDHFDALPNGKRRYYYI